MRIIKYLGRNSGEFGLTLVRSELDMLPAQNDEYRTVPGLDGAYHIPRELGNKELRIQFMVGSNSLAEWGERRRQIVAWLFSKVESKIEYDDEPGFYYLGKVTKMDLPDGDFRVKSFIVTFAIHPFRYSDPVVVTDEGSGEPTGEPGDETIIDEGTGTTPTEPVAQPVISDMLVDYTDLYETPFVFDITLTETIIGFAFYVNGVELIYDGGVEIGSEVVIDTRNMTVHINGELKVLEVSGDFALLQPGYNTISITTPGVRVLTYTGRSL